MPRPATDADVDAGLALIARIPEPIRPKEDAESFRRHYLDDPAKRTEYDADNGVLCSLLLEPPDRAVQVFAWLFDADATPQEQTKPALEGALRRLFRDFGLGIETWAIYGDVPAEGYADNLVAMFPRGIVRKRVSPRNPNLWRAESTVAAIAGALGIDTAALIRER